ncbi:C-type mannose receptor 2-like, partial [Scleropages formosus]
ISARLYCTQADYYFVNEAKSWDDAKQFCRKKYTDLATVQTPHDLEQLLKAAKGISYRMAWIGLRQTPPNWKWSNGQKVTRNEWDRYYFCAISNQYGTWVDTICDFQYPFMCYTEMPNGTRSYTLVQQAKSWGDAVRYCRQYYTDLVSILSVTENEAVMEAAQGVSQYWIGLSNNPWKWSDGQESSLRDWGKYQPNNIGNIQKCVIASESGWIDYYCDTNYPYYCCDETNDGSLNLTLVRQQKPWKDALSYCKQKYSDLVSVNNANESEAVRNWGKAGTEFWIGLYDDPWMWADGQNPTFRTWKDVVISSSVYCVSVNTQGTWGLYDCSTIVPFFCSG